mmetsp:Transcript_7032/g.17269  ORF Transcript_7032/g.17269 Transcript_7032/m.17269 type:complete len:97 (+) Transcript_7032:403-693(+)
MTSKIMSTFLLLCILMLITGGYCAPVKNPAEETYDFSECVGRPGNWCKICIEMDHHASLQVEVLNEEDAFSGEFRLDRVRVFVDGQGIVASEPRLG